MKFRNVLLVVNDMKKSEKFYKEVLGLDVELDFGANVTLTGGICLQTKQSWIEFISKGENEISFGGNDSELYFEVDDFDCFADRIGKIKNIDYVHPVIEHRWGQRVVRFYDPDKHVIEVGENMVEVCKRFIKKGLSVEETAKRMDVPVKYVESCIKQK